MKTHAPLGRLNRNSKALRIHGTIAHELGVAIVSGRYRPGDLLTGEVASSEKLEVSRTAYREAVRILSAKGLVESKPKVGTKVSDFEKWHLLDPDVLGWVFEKKPDLNLLHSLFELRNCVEPAAASFAALRRTEAHLADMKNAIDRMAHFTLAREEGRQADQDFHATLLRATDNPFIISLTSGVSAAINTTTVFKQRNLPRMRDSIPDHVRVFEAIAAGNPVRAGKAMSELIHLALRDMPMPRQARERPLSAWGIVRDRRKSNTKRKTRRANLRG